jgi:hypothetical protein
MLHPNVFRFLSERVLQTRGEEAMAVGRNDEHEMVGRLLERSPGTFSEQAGIALANTPMPLFQLLMLSILGAARVPASIALNGAHTLFNAGLRTPRHLCATSRRVVVDQLDRAGYVCFDGYAVATRLRRAAADTLDVYGGDLRRMERYSGRNAAILDAALREFSGVGPVTSAIFMREVQDVWEWLRPRFDRRALDGAAELDLPLASAELASLAPGDEIAPLAAALAQASNDELLRQSVVAG